MNLLSRLNRLARYLWGVARVLKGDIGHRVGIRVTYRAWCYKPDGTLRWEDGFSNLVVTLGRNALLNNTFDAPAGAVAWYVGLKDTGAPAAGDTMASHAGWDTITPYSNATDPAWTKNGSASGGAMSNSSSKAVFTINATDEVFGAFLKSDNEKGGTAGTLFGAGDFSASRNVLSGDTLNVQVDLSVTSS